MPYDPLSEQLRAESSNILEAMKWCKRKQDGAKTTMTSVFQLLLDIEEIDAIRITCVIGELADRSGNRKWATELLNEASDLARVRGYSSVLAKSLRQLAVLARWDGDLHLAIARLEEAIEIGRTTGSIGLAIVADACHTLGQLLMAQGRNRYALAEQYLLEGLQAAKTGKDHEMRAKLVGQLVYLYRDEGKYEKFYKLYRDEQHALQASPLAILLIGAAPRLIELGNFDEALDCIDKSRAIFSKENNLGGIAYTWRLQANWHWQRKEYSIAEEDFLKEEELRRRAVVEKAEERMYLHEALWEQHWFFIQTKQLDKAEQSLKKYLEVPGCPDWLVAQMLTQEAELMTDQKEYIRAFERCQEAIALYEKVENFGGIAWVKRLEGDIFSGQGHFESARQLYEEGLELRSHIDEAAHTADDSEHLAEFYLDRMRDLEQACKYFKRAQIEYQLIDTKKASQIEERIRALGCVQS